MNNATAIVIGAVIIAAAILIVFRWQFDGGLLLDRWTGTVVQCAASYSGSPPGKLIVNRDEVGGLRQATGVGAQALIRGTPL
jgi:hypothetical protein